MGLTISYHLSFLTSSIDNVHEKVLALQQIARTLGFMNIGEIVVLKDSDCTIDMDDDGKDPHIELKVHASEITGIGKGVSFSSAIPAILSDLPQLLAKAVPQQILDLDDTQIKRILRNGLGLAIAKPNMPES